MTTVRLHLRMGVERVLDADDAHLEDWWFVVTKRVRLRKVPRLYPNSRKRHNDGTARRPLLC